MLRLLPNMMLKAAPTRGPISFSSDFRTRPISELSKQFHENCGLLNNASDSVGCNLVLKSSLTTSAPLEHRKQMYWSAKSMRHIRKRHPFFWLMKPAWDTPMEEQGIDAENQEFLRNWVGSENKTKNIYALGQNESPLKNVSEEAMQAAESPPEYKPWSSIRTGLIARKIGIYPMWTKDGKRHQTTLLQVVDNHVIKYYPYDVYSQICRPLYRLRDRGLKKAAIVIGSESSDPQKFSSEYLGLFKEASVLPKRKLTKFHISEDAGLEPGTPLLASHFRPGMWVNVWGTSREWRFSGVRARWHMKGGPKTHGTTKAHNRIGSIGRGRKFAGPIRGKHMPGQKGRDRCIVKNLKVWRLNTKHNVLYVMGQNIPGINGSWVYIMDSWKNKEKYEGVIPFPTHFPDKDETPLPEELYADDYHRFNDETIVFVETEAERKALAALAHRGRAKTAQKKR